MPQIATIAPLASALADPARLRTFARAVLAGADGVGTDELEAAESGGRRHLQRLAQAGLVELRPDGTAVANTEAFAQALSPAEATEQDEVARLFKDGRLTTMPVRPPLRQALLEHLTERIFSPGVSYGEPEVNIALRQYWDDPSALRRYLVEAQLLTRSADGRAYRVTPA
ncbi:DUF2087 domain-containing protein [Streptacidiphilus sp. EB129]|uniref:DUF2087 domain-containing protein n=1 Tax=Streptacidiphilus sp. EB129 TaxID=3156262 RepID=UPI003511C8C6